ncbi:MAG: beta-galactosidase trimerization domain-containing protein [Verrucomicrobia bacterium]|nr:beta-galactosidase trimerization domain-containing protein [Verrucomicrobiota bacterium]MBU4291747.1 beta-galactosidase trimerization domain-containing protein [Verrucomicrobiota bacterium]MBU4429053.1 beta-galactosidase trimerization domain-containing protein [Verrucomicrobiota bacterium]MCG2679337.1 beta-galactosidase trimerization domain-containing protein [Kiritimatiellia bacterium]
MQNEKKWYEKPMRIAALQCSSEGKAMKVLDVWSNCGFDVEQLLHLSATGYSGYLMRDKEPQIRAYIKQAHKKGMRIIFYIAPGAGAEDFFKEHPDCIQKNAQGDKCGGACMNSPYRDRLIADTVDVARIGADGIFYDGPCVSASGCYCQYCRNLFRERHGQDLPKKEDVHDPLWHKFIDFRYDTIANYLIDANAALKAKFPEAILYMNGHHVASDIDTGRDNRRLIKGQDILGAEGGFIFYRRPEQIPYWKAGGTAKLIEAQSGGKPTVIFAAGDHKPWNRYLHTAAQTRLLYADSVANGASVWYGLHSPIDDMSHPGGQAAKEMNRFLAKNQKYYAGAKSMAHVALMRSAATIDYYQRETDMSDFTSEHQNKVEGLLGSFAKCFAGFYEILLRSHIPFDLVDEQSLWEDVMTRYDTLVLPNCACMDQRTAGAIRDFVASGKQVVASFNTSLYDELVVQKKDFALADVFGVSFMGDYHDFKTASYLSLATDHAVTKGIRQRLMPAPAWGCKVRADGAKVLAMFREPTHSQYVPLKPETTPAITVNTVGKGRAVFFAGNFGEHYLDYGIPEHRMLVANAVASFGKPLVTLADAPGSLEVVLRRQGPEAIGEGNQERIIVHLVNFTGEMRRPLERIIPCRNVEVTLNIGKKVSSVRALAANKPLKFAVKGRSVRFVVPEVREYEVIAVETKK